MSIERSSAVRISSKLRVLSPDEVVRVLPCIGSLIQRTFRPERRTHLLRELGEAKNLDYRRRQVGRTLSAVTMENGTALTTNYLQVQLAQPRLSNLLADLRIGTLTANGLAEASPFAVL